MPIIKGINIQSILFSFLIYNSIFFISLIKYIIKKYINCTLTAVLKLLVKVKTIEPIAI